MEAERITPKERESTPNWDASNRQTTTRSIDTRSPPRQPSTRTGQEAIPALDSAKPERIDEANSAISTTTTPGRTRHDRSTFQHRSSAA